MIESMSRCFTFQTADLLLRNQLFHSLQWKVRNEVCLPVSYFSPEHSMFLRFFPVLCIYVLTQLIDTRTVQRGLVYMSMVWLSCHPTESLKAKTDLVV